MNSFFFFVAQNNFIAFITLLRSFEMQVSFDVNNKFNPL